MRIPIGRGSSISNECIACPRCWNEPDTLHAYVRTGRDTGMGDHAYSSRRRNRIDVAVELVCADQLSTVWSEVRGRYRYAPLDRRIDGLDRLHPAAAIDRQ